MPDLPGPFSAAPPPGRVTDEEAPIHSPGSQRALPRPTSLLLIFGPVLGLVGIALVIHLVAGPSLNEISRDPLATLDSHPLMHAQSVLGVLILWRAAAISIFTWASLRRLGEQAPLASYFFWFGTLTAVLALDDQFQFHEDLGHRLLGLRERYIVAVLVVVLGVLLVRFRRVIAYSEWAVLGLAVVFAIGSLSGDLVSQQLLLAERLRVPDENLNYLEDIFKLLAIVSWSAYLIRFAHKTMVESFEGDADSHVRP